MPDSTKPGNPQFIQIAVGVSDSGFPYLYALDASGQVWFRDTGGNHKDMWIRVTNRRDG